MELLRIYDKFETDFSGNGIAVLDEASDICITQEINGDYSLTFNYPVHGAKRKYITNETTCRWGGQLFRIRIIDGENISAKAIYTDAARKHIQYIADMIGAEPQAIVTELFKDTPVHVMTESEIEALGMEWVDTLTDFFEQSKITPIGGLKTLTDQLEEQKAVCELYIDNYNIALVKRIGRDNAGRITLKFNASEISSLCDSSGLVTRLYPYGADDLDISTVNDGKQYIDSPNIDALGVYDGFLDFDDCEEPEELLRLAQWQFSEDNPGRIDRPKYSLDVKWADVSRIYQNAGIRAPQLGDRVSIYDEASGMTSSQRIIKTTIYPQEPEKSTIDVGQARTTFESFLGEINHAASSYEFMTNDRYITKTSSIEMMQKNKRVTINSQIANQKIALYRTGALFESPDGSCAVAIIQGNLAIAAGKTDGEWDWTTVIDDNQIIVSEVFTGALYTNLCSVLSENGKLNIEDSMITMYDASDTLRFECGYNGTRYVFCLYDKNGGRNVYIDDDGNAVFAGVISTQENAEVGANLVVGKRTSAGRIDFAGMINNSEGSISVTDHVMEIEANDILINSSSQGKVLINGRDVIDEIQNLWAAIGENESGA